MAEGDVLGHDAADANLDVVGMRADGEQIDRRYRRRHRVQPNTSSPFSTAPAAARASNRAARNASVADDPPPSAGLNVEVDEEHQLWPFNGEYWRDELPFYRQQVTSRCGR